MSDTVPNDIVRDDTVREDTADPNAAVGWHDDIADSFAEGYRRSPRFMEREAVWRPLIEQALLHGGRVLDAGCGSGVFSFIAATHAKHVDAIDGSANMIAIAEAERRRRSIGTIAFRQAMLSDLTMLPDASYDLIMSSSVLEYVEDYRAVIADFARLLRPGGTLLLSMPNAQSIYRKAEAVLFRLTGRPRYYAYVHNVVDAGQLAATLADVGITVRFTRFFAEPPLPWPARMLLPGDARRKTLFVVEAQLAEA